MINENGGADDKSVEIKLDDHIPKVPPVPAAVTVTKKKKKRVPKPRPILPPPRPVIGSVGHSARQLLNEKALEMYSDDESVYLSDNNEETVDVDAPIAKTSASSGATKSDWLNVFRFSGDKKENQANSQSGEAEPLIETSQIKGESGGSSASLEIKSSPLAPSEPKNIPPIEETGPSKEKVDNDAAETDLTPGLAALGASEDVESSNVNKGDTVGELEEPSNKRKRLIICLSILCLLIIAIIIGVVVSQSDNSGSSSSVAKSFDGTLIPTTSPEPSKFPSISPSTIPSSTPSVSPSSSPSLSGSPTTTPLPSVMAASPSFAPSAIPSFVPTTSPSFTPSTPIPSANPSFVPSISPSTSVPSAMPSGNPSFLRPSVSPTGFPTPVPSIAASGNPTISPSRLQTPIPTVAESGIPTVSRSMAPTSIPSVSPARSPTSVPSSNPSGTTSVSPTKLPTSVPSGSPTRGPVVATDSVWINNLLPFFGNNFPSTQLQREVLNELEASDNWEPDDLSDSRLWMERFVLSIFYEAVGGDDWNLRFGWRNPDSGVCDWFGVSCDSSDRVTSIMSQFNGLDGSLPSELGLLGELERLGLQRNQLQGTIPREFGNLNKLERLDLRNNDLGGSMPVEVEELAASGTEVLLDGNSVSCRNNIPNLEC